MKPVIHTLSRGPSLHGMSTWLKWLDCPLSAYLTEKERAKPESSALFVSSYSSALVGIIGHAYMEHYWKLKLDSTGLGVIRWKEDVVDRDANKEAQACVQALLGVIGEGGPIPLHDAGVVGVEEELNVSSLPTFGCDPFTCRVDAVLSLNGAHIEALKKYVAHDERLNVDGAVDLLKPGNWMVDYKFYSRRDYNLLDRSMGSTQFAAYQMAWEIARPEGVRGMIQITPFNIKEHPVRFTIVPPPSDRMRAVVKNLLSQAYEVVRKGGPVPKPLEHNCFPYGKVCPFMTSGQCNRS